eukprot:5592481-Alexandrium_andersonii.AAC.1
MAGHRALRGPRAAEVTAVRGRAMIRPERRSVALCPPARPVWGGCGAVGPPARPPSLGDCGVGKATLAKERRERRRRAFLRRPGEAGVGLPLGTPLAGEGAAAVAPTFCSAAVAAAAAAAAEGAAIATLEHLAALWRLAARALDAFGPIEGQVATEVGTYEAEAHEAGAREGRSGEAGNREAGVGAREDRAHEIETRKAW